MNTYDFTDLLPALTNEYGETFLQGVNRHSFMGKHSHSVYRSWFGPDYLQKNSLYIILGTDSGLLADYFIAQEIPPGTKIIFVELPEVIAWLKQQKSHLFSDENSINIISDTEFIENIESLGLENYIYLDSFYVTRSFAATDLYYPPYREMAQNVLQKAESFHWSYKTALSTRPFTINQLSNLPENHIHVSVLNNAFKGEQAILLAGGPSLEMIIPWLLDHREEIIILAVSRISKRLQEVGLIPDIIFSIDPNPINFNVSKEMFHFADHSLLVNQFHLYPKLLGQWKGPHVFVGTLFPWQSPHNKSIQQRSGSTVTNVALEVAINFGFSTIYLAGVDLCFDQKGFTHAKGSMEHKAGPMLEGGETTITTNDGRLADTTFAYKTAAANIAALAQWAKEEKQTRVINTHPGAARMEGVEYCNPSEIKFNGNTTTSSDTLMKKILAQLTDATPEGRKKHYSNVLEELKRANQALKQVEELSNKALLANKRLFAGVQREQKFIREMDRIEKRLNGDRFNFIRKLIKTFGIKNFLTIIRPDLDGEWTEKEIEEGGRQYYKAYRKSAKELQHLLKKCEKRIRARMEEDRSAPDFEKMLDMWREDEMPGRSVVFQARNPEACQKADIDIQEQLTQMQHEFQELINNGIPLASTPLAHLSTWNQQRAKKVRLRIRELYRNQNREGLQLIVDELTDNDQELVKPLRFLAMGMLLNLENKSENSRDQFQQIIDMGNEVDPLFLEDALQQICSLSLENGEKESAILALQCLYELSISYGPQYAKILSITGQTDKALEIYAEYLGKIPDDIDTMLALGNLYRQLNFPDGVSMVVDHVLERVPDNPQALELQNYCQEQLLKKS